MSKVRVHNIGISLDGYATGEGQSLEAPFGHAGLRLMQWYIGTETFQAQTGLRERAPISPDSSADDALARLAWEGIGVEIMGAGKFGPPGWQDDPDWRGWWGDDPPFHTPVIVLTHRPPREILELDGGNVFHFMNASPEVALDRARELAGGLDIRLGGGPTSIAEFLAADLVDHLHVAINPVILGRGVRLWDGLEGLEERFDTDFTPAPSGVVHAVFERRPR